MSEAIYGLLGGLGGAFITGAAAYWGPLQVQRRALAAQREQADHAREAARELAAQPEQADTTREAALASSQTRIEAETKRIILMRATTRNWRDLLAQTIHDLQLGMSVEIERFDEQARTARREAQSALDHALHDGVWIQQSAYGYPSGAVPQSGSEERLQVLASLERVTRITREAVINNGRGDSGWSMDLRRELDVADAARGAFSVALLNRLELGMEVTVLGVRTGAPSPEFPQREDSSPASDIQRPARVPGTAPRAETARPALLTHSQVTRQ